MLRTRIKICGITRVEDALCAANTGADAIGLIFYAASPRAVTIEQAAAISSVLPPFVSTVALFVNAAAEEVNEVIGRLRPAILQFHGDESASFCAQFDMPYLKAVRVGAGMATEDLLECAKKFSAARALLFDTMAHGLYGGSGESFDWNLIPEQMRDRAVLSGGLHPENVAGAIRLIRPWAVDVSSGVEASKGVKDHAKVRKFNEEVRNADAG
ncbi:MAG: phosphoribosylanthranilate isomerase [Burkholderiales bacterium]|nr:phosphoribosylanthranilate isomerase [Burkholderiales bacterium]